MSETGGGRENGESGARAQRGRSARQIEERIRARLRLCRLTARGMWHEVRYLIETDSERPGHLQQRGGPYPVDQLAVAAGWSARKVPQLLQVLVDRGLLERTDAGVLHAPLLTELQELRKCGRTRAERWRAKKSDAGVTCARSNARVTRRARDGPPALPFPPSYSPSTQPSPPEYGASAPAPPEAATPGAAAKAKRAGKRVRTDEEHRIRMTFIRGFCDRWAEWHDGVPYDFDAEDPTKRGINHRSAWAILDELVWNEEHAHQAGAYFARWCAESFAQFRVPLKHLAKDPKKWLGAAQRFETSGMLKIGGVTPPGSSNGDGYEIPAGRRAVTRGGDEATGPRTAAAG